MEEIQNINLSVVIRGRIWPCCSCFVYLYLPVPTLGLVSGPERAVAASFHIQDCFLQDATSAGNVAGDAASESVRTVAGTFLYNESGLSPTFFLNQPQSFQQEPMKKARVMEVTLHIFPIQHA